ncbi:MAG: hypothetical protein EXR07_04060 [Acetobacteraceae bacterium]|nr:hypothetical protein [Acetobacteraceae bacterium]
MQTYVYAGTSARTGGTVNGVFRRAVDDGRWERLTDGMPESAHVHAIAIHPTNTSNVFAATSTGVYRSLDNGAHWSRVVEPAPREQMWSVLVHPTNPRTILVGTAPLGLYRSDDGGGTWRRMPKPDVGERMVGCFPSRVMRLGIAPSRPDEIWAGLEVNGAMHSADGGETWTDRSDSLVALSKQPHLESAILSKDNAEGMLDVHAICVSPAAPGTAFLALRMGLFRSDNGGASWDDLGIGEHAAHLRYGRDIVVAPWDSNTMFACVSDKARGEAGRIYRSQDLGRSWSQFDHSIDVRSTMMAVALTPEDAAQAHCVTRGGQTFSTMDGGKSWREYDLPDGAGAAVAVACG